MTDHMDVVNARAASKRPARMMEIPVLTPEARPVMRKLRNGIHLKESTSLQILLNVNCHGI